MMKYIHIALFVAYTFTCSSQNSSGLFTRNDSLFFTNAAGQVSGIAKLPITLISGTNIKTINSTDITGSGNVVITGITAGSASLLNNFTTSNLTATSTNLTFSIGANEIYDVVITGTCSKATSATGLKFAIAAPAACTIKGFQLGGGATLAAALVPSLITAINTLGTTLATGIGIEVCFEIHFRVVNSSTAGAITFQAASVTSNALTIFAGTKMTWIKSTTL